MNSEDLLSSPLKQEFSDKQTLARAYMPTRTGVGMAFVVWKPDE
jgi:hypothetical protein